MDHQDAGSASEYGLLKENDELEFSFYRIPKDLIKQGLSHVSILLYGLLLDRWELSRKNGKQWVDEKGEVFLYFGRDQAAEELLVSIPTIRKAFEELAERGLIYEQRQGQNLPNKIYIINAPFMQRIEKKFHSGQKESFTPDRKNFSPNDTEYNDTELINRLATPKRSAKDYSEEFLSFWNDYPRKDGKAEAYKIWLKILKEGITPDQLIGAGKRYANQCEKKNTEQTYIRKGVNFLRHRTFEDYLHKPEPEEDPTKKALARLYAQSEVILGRDQSVP